MALWRDPFDELIDELDRTVPRDSAGDTEIPRLEDLLAVIAPILFAPKEDQARIFADPQYQQLHNSVMRQLIHAPDDQPIDPPTPRDLILDPES
jgi:hypothetical protein